MQLFIFSRFPIHVRNVLKGQMKVGNIPKLGHSVVGDVGKSFRNEENWSGFDLSFL